MVVLRQLCHLAYAELLKGLWDTAQAFQVTSIKKKKNPTDFGTRRHKLLPLTGVQGTDTLVILPASRHAAQISS